MTRQEFAELTKNGPVILDGATGTNLQNAGMPVGVCPEQWILENPDVMVKLQEDYVAAGTNILYAPTFTANRIKLEEYGLQDRLEEMNRELIAISKRAAKGRALVAADMTMTGQQSTQSGLSCLKNLWSIQRAGARDGGSRGRPFRSGDDDEPSGMSCRCACDQRGVRPAVMVSLTYNPDGRTLYGTEPATATVVLQGLGADAIGINCSTGPEDMIEPVRQMAQFATIPILAKPNAGLPELENGKTVYRTDAAEFASWGKKLVEAGAAIIGCGCGTTPEHIRALSEAVCGMQIHTPLTVKRRVLTSSDGW